MAFAVVGEGSPRAQQAAQDACEVAQVVEFDMGSTRPDLSAQSSAAELANWLALEPGRYARVLAPGNMDPEGQQLGLARAGALQSQLHALGAQPGLISIGSYDELAPEQVPHSPRDTVVLLSCMGVPGPDASGTVYVPGATAGVVVVPTAPLSTPVTAIPPVATVVAPTTSGVTVTTVPLPSVVPLPPAVPAPSLPAPAVAPPVVPVPSAVPPPTITTPVPGVVTPVPLAPVR